MKRQSKDSKYEGLSTVLKLLGIHFTRARLRLYHFLHDLTSAIRLPPRGKQKDRGLQLGANRTCIYDDDDEEDDDDDENADDDDDDDDAGDADDDDDEDEG